MNFFNEIYEKKLQENGEQIQFWEDYIKDLNDVQFKSYSDKLKVPVLVPIGSRILFRGELKHTNEVTTSLGQGYFAKCSTEQAEILRQHRIKDAKSKLDFALREKEYLEGQVLFKNQTIFDNPGPEIIEYQTDKEDRLWREQHKQNVKQYYENKSKKEEVNKDEKSDEELWNRLEELELQEELESELGKDTENDDMEDSFTDVKKEENDIGNVANKNHDNTKETPIEIEVESIENVETLILDDNIPEAAVSEATQINPENTNRLEILQNVLDKQKELEEKIADIKNRERNVTKTESDLVSRLDELEQMEEVEDEMDRLDDILYEPEPADEEEDKNTANVKRSVSFADQDESETLEITFKHSDVPANEESYEPKLGILRPSDIYDAYSHLFPETTSILRKPKRKSEIKEPSNEHKQNQTFNLQFKNDARNLVIVLDDVKENDSSKQNSADSRHKKPVSIFKKRRQQKK